MLAGADSVITSAPASIEASPPRFTEMSLGPSGVDAPTETFNRALVDATDEILPPNAGKPRTIALDEAENATPAVRSSPPSVIVPLLPRARRIPNAGRVIFKLVVLLDSV